MTNVLYISKMTDWIASKKKRLMQLRSLRKRRSMKLGMRSRIVIDSIMLLVLVVLLLGQGVGRTAHIALNVLFFILLVIHCIVNAKKLKLSVRKIRIAQLAMYLTLLALFFLAISSGLMLSELLFGQLNDREALQWHRIHGWSTRLMFVAVLVHVFSNRKALAVFFSKKKTASFNEERYSI